MLGDIKNIIVLNPCKQNQNSRSSIEEIVAIVDEDINIKTTNPEFLEWKWVDIDKITEIVVDFKFNVYKELKEKVKKIIS